ncbi:hypothetical protein RSO01_85170 [Reyranella soli]|uniref:Uncharacterized protein n=1 Tax=Reyranella soli TaxID=1230389 RepID=A0A512NQY8_9HYPH|nr:hypothetical protein RSO01_85170 [Reyranella soli]
MQATPRCAMRPHLQGTPGVEVGNLIDRAAAEGPNLSRGSQTVQGHTFGAVRKAQEKP